GGGCAGRRGGDRAPAAAAGRGPAVGGAAGRGRGAPGPGVRAHRRTRGRRPRRWRRIGPGKRAAVAAAQRRRAASRGPSLVPAAADAAGADYFSLASARSASALSVFSQEKAVATCFLPAPSV